MIKMFEINNDNAIIDALNPHSKLKFQLKHHNICWLENADLMNIYKIKHKSKLVFS